MELTHIRYIAHKVNNQYHHYRRLGSNRCSETHHLTRRIRAYDQTARHAPLTSVAPTSSAVRSARHETTSNKQVSEVIDGATVKSNDAPSSSTLHVFWANQEIWREKKFNLTDSF